MRLIDADTLIDWIRNDSGDKLMDSLYIDHINEMQTAYDVEKVVEKLEDIAIGVDVKQIGMMELVPLGDAIEIVKKGGGVDERI